MEANMLAALAVSADLIHVLAMLVWALGFPLLLWHRWPRLSEAYTVYALAFVLISQVSHFFLGECFLTTLSRLLWAEAGEHVIGTFTVRLVNAVAGVRPNERSAVLLWELLIASTALGVFFSLHRLHRAPAAGPIRERRA
jgi:hypothetical protein